MATVIFTVLVISPLARTEDVDTESIVSGLIVGILSWMLGHFIEGMVVQS